MAKSVRLKADQHERLERAARAAGLSQSTLIRDAVERRCDEILGETLAQRLADSIGVIQSGGHRARSSGEAFRRILRRSGATD